LNQPRERGTIWDRGSGVEGFFVFFLVYEIWRKQSMFCLLPRFLFFSPPYPLPFACLFGGTSPGMTIGGMQRPRRSSHAWFAPVVSFPAVIWFIRLYMFVSC
jgi:hypothetical protein